eukprot:TRINITY_DN5988_c0_g1_i1.p1 TRINITY_DN5988_c0_g1~~TRINITY_DN5988_c0_g1_i1.p1  ORF type:complete len:561 (-),score=123.16 TRINITY_DN5988_c0_g1_i1:42-1724(-)
MSITEEEVTLNPSNSPRLEMNISRAKFNVCLILVSVFSFLALVSLALSIIPYYTNRVQSTTIVFFHFSDFYQIDGIPGFPGDVNNTLGGLARLATLIKERNPSMITFGGDLFSPSSMTTFFNGPFQMVDGFNHLNQMKPIIAVAGNHEFDRFENTTEFFRLFEFPWLLANIYEPNTKVSFNGTQPTFVTVVNGVKIGFIGLAFDYRNVTNMKPSDISYEDYVVVAQRWVSSMKADGVQVIIALTHLPIPDEERLLKAIPGIDFCLAGHDHISTYEVINGHGLVEGSIDLSVLSVVTLSILQGPNSLIKQFSVDFVVPDASVPKDPAMQALIDKWLQKFEKDSSIVVGSTSVTLHSVPAFIRTKESNIGNFVADSLKTWGESQLEGMEIPLYPLIAVMNSGSLRWTTDVAAGSTLTKGKILDLLPFGNIAVVLIINGKILREALENSVSVLPLPGGRFLQISGFTFSHTCKMDANPVCDTPPGSRILNVTLNNGTAIEDNTPLYLALPDFISTGGDNFNLGSNYLVDVESGSSLFELIYNVISVQGTIHPVEDGRIREEGY